jgi:protein ImuB
MFVAIQIASFGLQTVLRQEPELRGRPLALLSDEMPSRILECSPEAEAQGVQLGMTSAQAQGRCPAIVFRQPAGPVLEMARDCVLQFAGAFSPWIEDTADGLVTLEWRSRSGEGTTEIPRWMQTALEKMVSGLVMLDFTATAGAARNPDLAIMAARCARPVLVLGENAAEFLASLPLDMLADEPLHETGAAAEARQQARARALQILRRWGIRTLGQLTALPKADLIERLGSEAGAFWDRAAGCSTRLLRLVRVPERFVEMYEFEQEVETLEPLFFILRRFVDQLTARLEAVHRVAAMLHLRLKFERGAPYVRELRVPSPTASAEVLFRMLTTHLENVRADAPISEVKLEIQSAPPPRRQFDLFSTRLRDPNQFFETLARLSAFIGADRVGTPVVLDTHRPDIYRLELPRFDSLSAPAIAEPPEHSLPLRRFRPLQSVNVILRGDMPAMLQSNFIAGPIHAVRGPWLSSGEWWTDHDWRRAEWDVQLDCGIYRLVQDPRGWWLEGVYD